MISTLHSAQMPLRTRLSNTGLKLKIPGRSSSSLSSPYGRSPTRPSSSPHRQGRNSQEVVTTFDASVDGRPVWSVTAERPRSSSRGFRDIPIVQGTPPAPSSLCDNKQSGDPLVPPSPSLPASERQLQRAEILRDWIESLPSEPISPRNPFFTPTPTPRPRPRPTHKKDLNYQPYKYLSSPLPNFDRSPRSSCR